MELAKRIALLKVDFMLSDEINAIRNPKRNDGKYNLLCETLLACYDLAQSFKGKLESNNPETPIECHVVKLVLPTENDEIILGDIKAKLADAINNCDEVNIDTDLKGNVRIHFGFEDIYVPREA